MLRLLSIVILASLLMSCGGHNPTTKPPEHYCHDTIAWEQWHELYQKYPSDDDIAVLYALRIGLCKMLVEGAIEADRAIKLFNQAHDTVIRKTEEEELRRKGGQQPAKL